MNLIFTGPPFAGKDTQAQLLSKKLSIPVFSMGHLIREARDAGDKRAIKGFEEYSMKGLHLPTSLKFPLLKEKLDTSKNGFILDNFPATQEDLDTFITYLTETSYSIQKVFYLTISEEEMEKRWTHRGRGDDNPEIIMARRKIQDQDRVPVLEYFKEQGLLCEINSEGEIEDIHREILYALNLE